VSHPEIVAVIVSGGVVFIAIMLFVISKTLEEILRELRERR
jgi:HAMP domain-containing protein